MKKLTIVALVLMLSGCNPIEEYNKISENEEKIQKLEAAINQYKDNTNEVENLSIQNKELLEKCETLESQITSLRELSFMEFNNIDELKRIFPGSASFDPAEKGYLIVACNSGLFSISCKNIKPYASGSEIIIQVVNMLGVSVTGVQLNFEYAKSGQFDYDVFTEVESLIEKFELARKTYSETKRERTETVELIRPGTAKDIVLRVPEYKPDEVRYVSISCKVNGIEYSPSK